MPLLGDYIGHLVSEIAIARMQTDLETIRIAELYASHPLLRTMSVPRFRLPDIEMNIPIVVEQMEEPRVGESPRGGVTSEQMIDAFTRTLTSQMQRYNIRASREVRTKLKTALDARSQQIEQPTEIAIAVNRIADELTKTAMGVLQDAGALEGVAKPAGAMVFQQELRDATRIEFLKSRTPPPRLSVLVTTQQIREIGTAENIVQIKLKITEEGMEWSSAEREGGQMLDYLVAE